MIHEYRTPKSKDHPDMAYTIENILVQVGQQVVTGQDLMEIGTDKANLKIDCLHSGIIEAIFVQENQEDVPQDQLLISIRETIGAVAAIETTHDTNLAPGSVSPEVPVEKEAEKKSENPAPETKPAALPQPRFPLPITPLAQAIADFMEINISDIETLPGSLRITSAQVLDFAKKQRKATFSPAISPKPLPDFSKYGPIESEKFNSIGKSTAKHLTQVWTSVPHAWMMEKADITALAQHRENARQTVNLSWTALYIKAVVSVLKQFPHCNASFDAAEERIILKKYYHIGVAVDTPDGLVVPVVRDADRKSLAEIAADLGRFTQKAKGEGGKFSMEDFEGHTFSISNVGMFGSTGILPIVHAPDSAILGLTSAKKEVIWDETAQLAVPRLLLPMTLGFDHRVVNGAAASRFLATLKKTLEGPILGWT